MILRNSRQPERRAKKFHEDVVEDGHPRDGVEGEGEDEQ